MPLNADDSALQYVSAAGGKPEKEPEHKLGAASAASSVGGLQLSLTRTHLPAEGERPHTRIELRLPSFGVSCVDATPREVLFFSITRIMTVVEDSRDQRTIELSIAGLQLDNQNQGARRRFPVILSPTDSYAGVMDPDVAEKQAAEAAAKSQALVAAGLPPPPPTPPPPKPFIQIALNQTKTLPDFPCSVYQYCSLLVQQMDLNIEEVMIWELLKFLNEFAGQIRSVCLLD
jgi:hypothetical protein